MAFNEQGEIIRPGTGRGTYDSSMPPNNSTDYNDVGCSLMIIIILVIFFAGTCSTSNRRPVDIDNLQTDYSQEIINPYGTGNGQVTFYKTFLDTAEVEIIVGNEYIGSLSESCYRANAVCDGPKTISKILPVGYHSVKALGKNGQNGHYRLRIVEGECQIQALELYKSEPKPLNIKLAEIIEGDWYGNVYQYDTNESWDIVLSCNSSTRDYKISYPSLGCTGIWNIEDVSGQTIFFREQIFFGKGKCADFWEVDLKIINSKKIQVNYYYPSGQTLMAKGILTKL